MFGASSIRPVLKVLAMVNIPMLFACAAVLRQILRLSDDAMRNFVLLG
jgi:hypothetical protein